MKASVVKIFKYIGIGAGYLVFGFLQLIMLIFVSETNYLFFTESNFSTSGVALAGEIFFYVVAFLSVATAVISVFGRKKKLLNWISLLVIAVSALAAAITFAVFLAVFSNEYAFAFENFNLYGIYMLSVILANLFSIYSVVFNLIRFKRTPITFQKSVKAE